MAVERWGAFSVVDHRDASKLAAEVILYDRLLMPQPEEWDRKRWSKKGWKPKAMDDRIRQLGGIAIGARWDLARQKEWAEKIAALGEDVKEINDDENNNLGYTLTRRVLADNARDYRPAGVEAVEAICAYQSEADFRKLDPRASEQQRAAEQVAQHTCLIANAILIPAEQDPEESLKRAIGLAGNDTFVQRRRRFHEWQRDILARGILPADAARDLGNLVREYNEAIAASGRSCRIDTAMLVVGLGAATLAAAGALAPAAVALVGIGAFTGAQVVSLGTAATGGILQIVRHVRGLREPDAATRNNLSGAMFHQLKKEIGWTLRP